MLPKKNKLIHKTSTDTTESNRDTFSGSRPKKLRKIEEVRLS